jgi:predicted permease
MSSLRAWCLRLSPGFTVVAVLTLALGVGANTAIFSVVNAALLRSLPFRTSNRLVALQKLTTRHQQSWVSYPDFLDWERENHSLEAVAIWRDADLNLSIGDGTEQLTGKMVSSTFFPALGVQPILGRNFTADEDRLAAEPVALLSEGVWRSRFGAASDIVGQNIVLDGRDYAVIGIMPSSFHFPRSQWAGTRLDADDFFTPIGQWDNKAFRDRTVSMGTWVIGLLKPNVTLSQANADLDALGRKLATNYPDADGDTTISAIPLRKDIVGNLQPMLFVLLGAVGLVLLIACANVANLLLARSEARSREFAIRVALGAIRGKIVRQLLTESLMLSLLGGTLAVLFAEWGTGPALRALPITLPEIVKVEVDVRVLAFAFAASVLTGLIFGLAPALYSSKPIHRLEALNESSRTIVTGRSRTQSTLAAGEIAFALMLLVGAGLMIRSLSRLWSVNPGFDALNLMTFVVALPPSDKPDLERMHLRHRELLDALSRINGVESAGLSFGALPMNGQGIVPFWLEGEPVTAPKDARSALWFPVSPGYLKTMGIPLLRGRALAPSDNHTSPLVVVIDEKLAQNVFPGQDPIGKRLNIGYAGLAQIVGIAGHIKQFGLDEDPAATVQSQFYTPIEQVPDQFAVAAINMAVVVLRSSVPPEGVLPAIRQQFSAIDSREVISRPRMIADVITDSQSQRRFSMFLLSGFAAIALFLAALGVYGVLSFVMSQRTHEVGIRMALGAQRKDLLRMVVGNGMKLVLVGVALGVIGAMALTHLLTKLLFGVAPTDPTTFISVSLLIFGVAFLASYIPARRAAKVDPMVALRFE